MVVGAFNGMSAWMVLVKKRSSELAPFDTGRLARSIHTDDAFPIESAPLIFEGQIGTNVEYARAHELGSGIHALDPAARELIVIEAGFWTGKSDKKALNFPWADGPKDHPAYNETGPYAGTFTFRRIYHPGVKPAWGGQGYMRKAGHESVDEARRLMLAAIIAELVRGKRS